MFEMKMVDMVCNKEPFELSKAMKTMIQIQQNRYRRTINENNFNKNDTNYNLIIEEILTKQYNKEDEVYMESRIDSEMSLKSNDTIMPTMASLSHNSKLESKRNSIKMATLLVKDCVKKQDKDIKPSTCCDDNILQSFNKNFKNKIRIQSKLLEENKCSNKCHECCTDISTINCFHQKPNDDVVSISTNFIIDEPLDCYISKEKTIDSSCSSNSSSSITLDSGHYYDMLHCKQRLKHEKCDIHGIDLKMICAFPIDNFSAKNRIRKEVIRRYGACDTYIKKPIKIKKSINSNLKPSFQQNSKVAKIMSKEEQIFESYKALGYAKKAHHHLNEYDSNSFVSNRRRNIPMKSRSMKVKDQELHKMIDDIMLLNHNFESKSIK